MRIDATIPKEIPEAIKPKLAELKKATQSFEAVFLKKLFSTMREGVKHVSLGDSMGEDMYKDMFDQALADDASKSGSYGIGEILYRSFAPRVIAMEELRLKAESPNSTGEPAREDSRPTSMGPSSDAPLQHKPDLTKRNASDR